MGIFDPPQEKLEEAYGQGVQDSREATQLEQAVHDLGEFLTAGLPTDPEVDSYNQGWEDQTTGEVK